MQSSVIQAKLTRLSNLLFESFENVVVQFVKESALQNNDENICIFGQFISLFEKVNSQLSTKLLVLGELLVSRYDPISQAPFKVPLWTLIRRITQLVTVNCQSSNYAMFIYLSLYLNFSKSMCIIICCFSLLFRFVDEGYRIKTMGRTVLFNMWRCCE